MGVKGIKTKANIIESFVKEKREYLTAKRNKIVRSILENANYFDVNKGIRVRNYCESVEIEIYVNNENPIQLHDIVNAIAESNVVEVINKAREIHRYYKKKVKELIEWKEKQISKLLRDEKLDELPEIKWEL